MADQGLQLVARQTQPEDVAAIEAAVLAAYRATLIEPNTPTLVCLAISQLQKVNNDTSQTVCRGFFRDGFPSMGQRA